jgi:bifunctional UDP-N-acetylglucosamine pyrophosphorylase/glucosamine-1-phosphate N-acetyltransferase
MLEWIVDGLNGVASEVFIIVRKEQTDIIHHFKNRSGVKFIYQDKPMGTAHALLQANVYLAGDFLLLNGDVLTTPKNIKEIAAMSAPVISGYRVENPEIFGVLSVEGGKVTGIEEKPLKPKSNLINAGVYKLNDSIFAQLRRMEKSERGEFELVDFLPYPANLVEIDRWAHISYPWDYLEANRFVLENWGSRISPKAKIKPGAVIEEPVAIGDDAVVGPNCYIRSFSSVGPGCKVGNAVELKNTIIMTGTFVSHLSYVGDSVIGRNCNVAAGTIFANLRLDEKTIRIANNGKLVDSGKRKLGAIVADNVKFGVNCTVMPGARIWPNLLIPPCSITKGDVTKQPDLKSWKRVLT